jgi:uncharacterized protein YllA (UPF0747 family)
MIQFPMQIPIHEIGEGSRLFMDYVSGGDTPATSILGGFQRGENRWEEVIGQTAHAADVGKQSWETLVDRLVAYNQTVGVGGDLLDKLRNAKDGGVRFVVTGQQPGVLGGPLLSLYKVMTAIAVSDHVERSYNVPCVPLYWVGADDVDFQEVRELFLVDSDLTPLSTAIAHDAYQAASPVGDISAQAVRDVWEAVEPLVSRCPHGKYVSKIVVDALDGATDHGVVTARVIAALTGGRAALIDGRDPAVRVHARDLFLRFFDQEEHVRQLVAESGRSLEEAGYHAQLWLGPDSGVFMVEGGRRKKIVDEKRQDLRARLAEDVGRFSPGVALRNLVQDSVFRPVAAVLGPAEIAYRAQLDRVYDAMDVRRPVTFPRLQATYVSPPVEALLRSLEALGNRDLVQLHANPTAFVKSIYASQRSDKIKAAEEHFKRAFRAGADEFLKSIDGALDQKTVEKSKRRLAEVSRRLEQVLDITEDAARTVSLRRWPFLGALGDYLKRKDKMQDRYLSLLTPFLFSGTDGYQSLTAATNAFVEGTLDGNVRFVVYSA